MADGTALDEVKQQLEEMRQSRDYHVAAARQVREALADAATARDKALTDGARWLAERDAAQREAERHRLGAEEFRAEIEKVKAALGLLSGGVGLSLAAHVTALRERVATLERKKEEKARLVAMIAAEATNRATWDLVEAGVSRAEAAERRVTELEAELSAEQEKARGAGENHVRALERLVDVTSERDEARRLHGKLVLDGSKAISEAEARATAAEADNTALLEALHGCLGCFEGMAQGAQENGQVALASVNSMRADSIRAIVTKPHPGTGLREAVAPFAAMAERVEGVEALRRRGDACDVHTICDDGGRFVAVNLGDYRRLRAALAGR